MNKERVLLLSGPQHYDAQRPVMGGIREIFEHADPLGIAIVAAVLKKYGLLVGGVCRTGGNWGNGK